MNNKIIIICGFSSAGKDKVTKYISENYNYKFITSHTSRPIRLNESEGNPYHFISKQKFEKMIENNEFIEYRKYSTLVNNVPDIWYYGVHKNSVNLSQNSYVVVLDMLGTIEFKKYFGDSIISFFIDVDEPTRKQRCINRKDFDEYEWNRRYKDDIKQFPKEIIKNEIDYIIKNYDFDKCINKISNIINGGNNEKV